MGSWSILEPAPDWTLHIAVSERGVRRLSVAITTERLLEELGGGQWRRDDQHTLIREAVRQLGLYFRGQLREFDLPLELEGTPFQLRVWNSLLRIPYGETRSYAELAREVGRPGAARAVGQANGHNPVGVVVPCHRVIASDGGLGGYAGGLDYKRRLLSLEAMNRMSSSSPATSSLILSQKTGG